MGSYYYESISLIQFNKNEYIIWLKYKIGDQFPYLFPIFDIKIIKIKNNTFIQLSSALKRLSVAVPALIKELINWQIFDKIKLENI